MVVLVLFGIGARNYRQFRSKQPPGLSVFALFLIVENLLSLYYTVGHND